MFGFFAERPMFSWLLSHLGPPPPPPRRHFSKTWDSGPQHWSLPASRGSASAPRAAMHRSAMAPLEPDNYVFTNR